MDISKFVEAAKETKLPFVLTGDGLKNEAVQKTLAMMNLSDPVEVFIGGQTVDWGREGLAITENEISYILGKGELEKEITVGGIKTAGERRWSLKFKYFVPHNVSVEHNILIPSALNVDLVLQYKHEGKDKYVSFQFRLMWQDEPVSDSVLSDFATLLDTITVKYGNEYIPTYEPNVFDFLYFGGKTGTHTRIIDTDKELEITTFKIDQKSKIQSQKKASVTLDKSRILNVVKATAFDAKPMFTMLLAGLMIYCGVSFLSLLLWAIVGILGKVGFVIVNIILVVCFALGIYSGFHKTLKILCKNGTRFSIPFDTEDADKTVYERFVNTLFK